MYFRFFVLKIAALFFVFVFTASLFTFHLSLFIVLRICSFCYIFVSVTASLFLFIMNLYMLFKVCLFFFALLVRSESLHVSSECFPLSPNLVCFLHSKSLHFVSESLHFSLNLFRSLECLSSRRIFLYISFESRRVALNLFMFRLFVLLHGESLHVSSGCLHVYNNIFIYFL